MGLSRNILASHPLSETLVMAVSNSVACFRVILCGISGKLNVGDGTVFVLKLLTSMEVVDKIRQWKIS